MVLQRIRYGFSMRLPAPRDWTYRWATDYRPGDFDIMGLKARRRVEQLSTDLVLLTDSFNVDPFHTGPATGSVKEKLVHLYPATYSWTSTHISGPAKFSQFLYELSPDGSRSSKFRYTGAQVEQTRSAPTRSSVAARARTLRTEDVKIWRNLRKSIAGEYR
jgi:hypothetical protein